MGDFENVTPSTAGNHGDQRLTVSPCKPVYFCCNYHESLWEFTRFWSLPLVAVLGTAIFKMARVASFNYKDVKNAATLLRKGSVYESSCCFHFPSPWPEIGCTSLPPRIFYVFFINSWFFWSRMRWMETWKQWILFEMTRLRRIWEKMKKTRNKIVTSWYKTSVSVL